MPLNSFTNFTECRFPHGSFLQQVVFNISAYRVITVCSNNIKLVFPGKPHAPRNCTLWNQTLDSVEVSCVPGFDGGLPQRFLLEVYSGNEKYPRYEKFL